MILPVLCGIVFSLPAFGSAYRGGWYDGYDRAADRGGIGHPQVNNADGATNVQPTAAWLNGTLTATGSAAAVVMVYWGGTDAGTNKAGWHTNRSFGVRAEGVYLTTNVTVSPHTRYYYRFYATNAAGEDGWSASAATFVTPGPPVLTPGYGATPVGYTTAALNGNFINGVSAALAVFWGTDTNAWAYTNGLGTRAEGRFRVWARGLTPGTVYYYRSRGSNTYGYGWSDVVAFTTPVSTLVFRGGWYDGYDQAADRGGAGVSQVNNADGATNITSTGAWLNGTLTATGSAANAVTVYWGPADGGTNRNAWNAGIPFGVRGLGERLTTNVMLSPYTRYYYRFYATNAAGEEAWAAETAAFTTPGIPQLNAGVGAAPVSYTTARLNGNFTNGLSATISILWGTDTNVWAYTNTFGTRSQGQFACRISSLGEGTRYYYRCRGVNAYGEGWSEIIVFTTRVSSAVSFYGGWYDGYDQYGGQDEVNEALAAGSLFMFR